MNDSQNKQPSANEVIEGEVVAEFEGETFMNLPPVPDRAQDSVHPASDGDANRRNFLLRLLFGGGAALAVGGGAAYLYNESRRDPNTTEVILPYGAQPGDPNLPANVAELAQRVADLEYQLATSTAERDQALSDLNTSTTQLQELSNQLDIASAQLEESRGLNALWQSLDDVGLDALLTAALAAANVSFTTFVNVLGFLQLGLTNGEAALGRFLSALPSPKDGMRWLQARVNQLTTDLDFLAEQVQEAVEPAQSFTTLIGEFILWVLDRLPFGAGDQARAGMEAMQKVVNSLPVLVEGVVADVIDPLGAWFSDDSTRGIAAILLDPIREGLVDPAHDVITRFVDFKKVYEDTLVGPTDDALQQRAAIRQQIQASSGRQETHS